MNIENFRNIIGMRIDATREFRNIVWVDVANIGAYDLEIDGDRFNMAEATLFPNGTGAGMTVWLWDNAGAQYINSIRCPANGGAGSVSFTNQNTAVWTISPNAKIRFNITYGPNKFAVVVTAKAETFSTHSIESVTYIGN